MSKSKEEPRSRLCHVLEAPRPKLPPMDKGRARAISMYEKKWLNGTELHYYFMGGSQSYRESVRRGFRDWEEIGIGISFKEVSNKNSSDIRVSFANSGSWSYVGTDCSLIPKNQATTNFGWDITQDHDTVLHEIGHAMSLQHEHQNPKAGIKWNKSSVYQEYQGYPNYWDQSTTYNNIIRKIPVDDVQGSSWDKNSIMHYQFGAGLIISPADCRNGVYPQKGLSPLDIEVVRELYPSQDTGDPTQIYEDLEPGYYTLVDFSAGDQVNYNLVGFEEGLYVFGVLGKCDTSMRLVQDGFTYHEDDDSGYEQNAKIEANIWNGHDYILRVRCQWRDNDIDPDLILKRVA